MLHCFKGCEANETSPIVDHESNFTEIQEFAAFDYSFAMHPQSVRESVVRFVRATESREVQRHHSVVWRKGAKELSVYETPRRLAVQT